MRSKILLFASVSALVSCKSGGRSGVKDSPSEGGLWRLSCPIYYQNENGSPIHENWDAFADEQNTGSGIDYIVDFTDPKTQVKLYVAAYAESREITSGRRYFGQIKEVKITAPGGETASAKTDGPLRNDTRSTVAIDGLKIDTPEGQAVGLEAKCQMFVSHEWTPND
jgi:hypothetical protein